MELLKAINREIYPAGTFLPSLERLAKERQVSVSTIRRTLTLLNSIGVTKSFNGLGTQILPQEEIAENCDFTNPVLQRRLLDYAQSMQIIALSCREVSRITAAAFTPADRARVMERLKLLQRLGRQELASYAFLNSSRTWLLTRQSEIYTLNCTNSFYGDIRCAASLRIRRAVLPVLRILIRL